MIPRCCSGLTGVGGWGWRVSDPSTHPCGRDDKRVFFGPSEKQGFTQPSEGPWTSWEQGLSPPGGAVLEHTQQGSRRGLAPARATWAWTECGVLKACGPHGMEGRGKRWVVS